MFYLLHGKPLTSVHDYWKNHSFDYTELCQQSDISGFEYVIQVLVHPMDKYPTCLHSQTDTSSPKLCDRLPSKPFSISDHNHKRTRSTEPLNVKIHYFYTSEYLTDSCVIFSLLKPHLGTLWYE